MLTVLPTLLSGTFSSVYKAIDKNHHLYDNYVWTGKLPGPPPEVHLRGGMSGKRTKPMYVALKRIYVTSSPARILNELEIMEDLRDCQHIAYLISAFRTEDQIVAVMPYSRHADFRVSEEGERTRGLAFSSCAHPFPGVLSHHAAHRPQVLLSVPLWRTGWCTCKQHHPP